jgi:hypothetical protein
MLLSRSGDPRQRANQNPLKGPPENRTAEMVIKKNKENKKRVFDTGKPLLTPAPTLCFFVFPSSLGPAGADGKLNV